MAKEKYIEIKGARANNLKNIDVKIPQGKFVAITGVSGSGKSSLAFDTLYAEGQRRYVESLSSYARQFLGRMSKPECDFIKGLPPAIAIEQKVISRNPRSTVGTTTEIYEYLRLLYARIGRTYSPISGQEVKRHSPEDILTCTRQYSKGTKFVLLAPIRIGEGRTLLQQMEMYMQEGYARLYTKGEFMRIEEYIARVDTNLMHLKGKDLEELLNKDGEGIYLVIDRASVSDEKDDISRLMDSAETAFYEGDGTCRLVFLPSNISYDFSTKFEADGIKFERPTDNMFAFNSPLGACPTCEGFGSTIGIDEKLVIPDTSMSLYDGCVVCWRGEKMGMWKNEFIRRVEQGGFDFPIFKPYYELTQKQKDWLWHGLPTEKDRDPHDRVSIDEFFRMVKENQYKIQYRVMLSRFRGKTICPTCHGTRLRKEANYVKIGGKSITELVEMSIVNLSEWFKHLELTDHEKEIGKRLLAEITHRLQFLLDVGLGYLTLNRPSNTLSGGESQRINLTTNLGSSLVGSVYILDEPSIGLHSRDTDRLIKVLRELQQLGNTVVVVEHDEEIMRAADYLIDIGPDAGRLGGRLVYAGPSSEYSTTDPQKQKALLEKYPESHTIQYLTHQEKIERPTSHRAWNRAIEIKGARMNNLRGIDVKIPLNIFTVVTGVSGSGKSSLIKGILYPALRRHLDLVADIPGEYTSMEGDVDAVKHVEFVDQNPIGKSTRSNPATYLKAYDSIRSLFANQPLAKQMGFTAAYFSFNSEGGRCEECKGAGYVTIEMQFMADLTLTCEACKGKRFKHEILEVHYGGKDINDVLNMTVNEAIEFFSDEKLQRNEGDFDYCRTIVNRLLPLQEVGLGYIKLGQNSSTLSGGENQRVKLAYFIGKEDQEPTLFIFDEPTTGLHFHDIKRLLHAFNALIERGHSLVVIEHNMDVIKCADYIIDLGPEGGDKGGNLVAEGTPEDIAACQESLTGQWLKGQM